MPITAERSLLFSLHVTERCNLACGYCYAPKSRRVMSRETAVDALRFLARVRNRYDHVTVVLIGGEPLLELDRLRQIVRLAREIAGVRDFILPTNATLLDESLLRWLARERIAPHYGLHGIFDHIDGASPATARRRWRAVERSLELAARCCDRFYDDAPNPLCLRLTFTAETAGRLGAAVRYLADRFGKKAFIVAMPAMPFPEDCRRPARSGTLKALLKRELLAIAGLHRERAALGAPFTLIINECFDLDCWSGFGRARGFEEAPSCGAGRRMISASLDGRLFPCYLAAADPDANERFRLGSASGGITRPQAVSDFRGGGGNEAFSCLYWNRLETGSPAVPARAYRALYEGWRAAVASLRAPHRP
ncbi:MAG: radical SAM protein [Elusimicrobia bacterium]|nr:radical SAM protein [Elusimicrobiota bacterium]MDE2425164.1 radical SAM protein [Elusimicrobiota bacterium]